MYLQHGLIDSSDAWVINSEELAPAFYYANKGFDVWLGNMRGNSYSRNHNKFNPDKDKEYWYWSFD
jgi:pimeloyl-ACP methyl ester carboxylesterase